MLLQLARSGVPQSSCAASNQDLHYAEVCTSPHWHHPCRHLGVSSPATATLAIKLNKGVRFLGRRNVHSARPHIRSDVVVLAGDEHRLCDDLRCRRSACKGALPGWFAPRISCSWREHCPASSVPTRFAVSAGLRQRRCYTLVGFTRGTSKCRRGIATPCDRCPPAGRGRTHAAQCGTIILVRNIRSSLVVIPRRIGANRTVAEFAPVDRGSVLLRRAEWSRYEC